jgi:hypothetical protein
MTGNLNFIKANYVFDPDRSVGKKKQKKKHFESAD